MKKKIFVFLCHPDSESFCAALHNAYVRGARGAGFEVREMKIGEMEFDPILHKGYKVIQELEPDLRIAQENIKWADHLVFIFPTWWGVYPALLKGFLDRAILPGFAFKYKNDGDIFPKCLLKGKSGRLITTMAAPSWFYTIVFGAAGIKSMKRAVLAFCGVSPVRVTKIGRAENLKRERFEKWIKKMENLGRKGE